MAQDAFFVELLQYRLLGCGVWFTGLVSFCNLLWLCLPPLAGNVVFSWANLTTWLFLSTLQFAVLFSHRAVLSASEHPPLTFPPLGIHSRSWTSLVLTRILVRGRQVTDNISVLCLAASTCLSAIISLVVLPRTKWPAPSTPPFLWSLWYGLVLGLTYTTGHLLRGRDILTYPTVQRPRYFRLKRRLPSGVYNASVTTTTGLAVALILCRRCRPTWHQLYSSSISAFVCVLGWHLASEVLQAVFSETTELWSKEMPSSNRLLLAALDSPSSPLLQDAALLDLATFCNRSTTTAKLRREALFAEDTVWNRVASGLLGEINDLTKAVSAGMGTIAAKAQQAARSNGATDGQQWNVLRLSPSMGMRQVSEQQDLAAWHVRSRFYRVRWAMQSLCGLLAAAIHEDRLGNTVLTRPNQPEIITDIVTCALILQQYTKHTVTASKFKQPLWLDQLYRWLPIQRRSTGLSGIAFENSQAVHTIEGAAWALSSEARICVAQVLRSIPTVLDAVEKAKLTPGVSSVTTGDVLAFLRAPL